MRYLYLLLCVFALSGFISHQAGASVYDAGTQWKAIDTVTTVDCSGDKDSDPGSDND